MNCSDSSCSSDGKIDISIAPDVDATGGCGGGGGGGGGGGDGATCCSGWCTNRLASLGAWLDRNSCERDLESERRLLVPVGLR